MELLDPESSNWKWWGGELKLRGLTRYLFMQVKYQHPQSIMHISPGPLSLSKVYIKNRYSVVIDPD
jgi:hypothetical protein